MTMELEMHSRKKAQKSQKSGITSALPLTEMESQSNFQTRRQSVNFEPFAPLCGSSSSLF